MKKIVIENTRGVKHLEFNFPEQNGIYYLAGINGSGKSTLLVCLARISDGYAFAHNFLTKSSDQNIDQYIDSVVTYEVDTNSASFRKKTKKWRSKKNNKAVLNAFGIGDVIFIKAESKRIEANPNDIRPGINRNVAKGIVTAMNEIFQTTRFETLYKLRNSTGPGRGGNQFYLVKIGAKSYSEKWFSSGELAILKLVERIESISASATTLVLLDEAEMALHPTVQRKLIAYLQQKSHEKNLMIFVATHSTTLLNDAPKDKIILLNKSLDGKVELITPCYPKYAIGFLDKIDYAGYDFIFFVEDEMAKMFLEKLINRYLNIDHRHKTLSKIIHPIGGYLQTAKFAVDSSHNLFSNSKLYAVVDHDAFETDEEKDPGFQELRETDDGRRIIRDLSVTPELFIIDRLEEINDANKEFFRQHLHLDHCDTLKCSDYLSKKTRLRHVAKDKFNYLIRKGHENRGRTEEFISETVFDFVIQTYISDDEVKSIVAPMLNPRKN